jgi:hypothetical protein
LVKLNVLTAWARDGIPRSKAGEFEKTPVTPRQFNAWSSDDLSAANRKVLPKFARHANQTLNKHSDLRQKLTLVQRALREALQLKPKSKSRLEEQLALERRLRAIAENEVVNMRSKLKDEQRERTRALDRLQISEQDFRAFVDGLEQENSRLRQEVADLTRKIAKIAPIGVRHR